MMQAGTHNLGDKEGDRIKFLMFQLCQCIIESGSK